MQEPMERLEDPDLEPTLEIKPSETYYPRPMWQKVCAWIFIGLLVLATISCAFWKLR